MDFTKNFTKEQLKFIEETCGVNEEKFRKMTPKEVFDVIIEEMVRLMMYFV